MKCRGSLSARRRPYPICLEFSQSETGVEEKKKKLKSDKIGPIGQVVDRVALEKARIEAAE